MHTPFWTLLRRAVASLATAVVFAQLLGHAAAQAPRYSGVGGRHEQSRYFIQRNVPNPSGGQVTVPSTGSTRRIFVRFLTGSTTDPVTGFDVNMRFQARGEVVPAWFYTANSQDKPGSVMSTGQIGISLGMRYCRASFPTAVTVQPNKLYFLAFELPAGEDLKLNTSSTGSQVTYFVGANGAAQQARLQYGVHRGGFSPAITMTQPFIGQNFRVDLDGASLNREAVLAFQLPTPGLPTDLHSFGAPGSFWYLDLNNALFAGLAMGEPDRTRRLTFTMANNPNLIGQTMFYQWQVLTNDAGIPSGWVTSNRARCVIR
jgi:hypothetical protein